MTSIIGTYECKVDAKGRLPIPAGIKKQILSMTEDDFVLKRSVFQPCLELYPMKEWQAIMGKVNQLNRFVKKNNDFIRNFSAGVKLVSLDSNGRIQISKDLIGFSGIDKEVVVAGAAGIIEIWDKDKYEASITQSADDFANLAEEVMGNIDFGNNELS